MRNTQGDSEEHARGQWGTRKGTVGNMQGDSEEHARGQ